MAVQLLFSKPQPATTTLLFGSTGGEAVFVLVGESAAASTVADVLSAAYVIRAETVSAGADGFGNQITLGQSAEQVVAQDSSAQGSLQTVTGSAQTTAQETGGCWQARSLLASEAAAAVGGQSAAASLPAHGSATTLADQIASLGAAVLTLVATESALLTDEVFPLRYLSTNENAAASALDSFSSGVVYKASRSELISLIETLTATFAGQMILVMVDPHGDFVLIRSTPTSRVEVGVERTTCFKSNPSNSDVI